MESNKYNTGIFSRYTKLRNNRQHEITIPLQYLYRPLILQPPLATSTPLPSWPEQSTTPQHAKRVFFIFLLINFHLILSYYLRQFIKLFLLSSSSSRLLLAVNLILSHICIFLTSFTMSMAHFAVN